MPFPRISFRNIHLEKKEKNVSVASLYYNATIMSVLAAFQHIC